MEQQRPKRTRTIYFIIAILILLASNGIFVYNYFTTDKKLVKTEEELFATDSAKTALGKLLQETDLELENYKGKNAELDAFLKQKNDSLLEFAHRISILIRQNRVNKDQLDQALEEIDQLRYYKRKSITQIDSLSNQISLLNRENTGLKSTIDKEKRRNEDLTMENVRLGNKVAIGSKLLTKQLVVTGIRVRSSGKEKLTIKVSQIEKLKVTFLIEPNYVTNPGPKQIFLKVVGPDGGTLYNENSGSGTFLFEGEDARYTAVKEIEFTQEGQAVSIYWEKGSPYEAGEYKIELYCEGMNIGKGSLLLK
ncbi:MAG: hypothetical protein WC760_03435 [Bacteroidia bacterium]|jgi:hypothetical protein